LIADVKQPIILVTELGQEEESVTRLNRVGFDNLVGHLQVDLKLGKNAGKETDAVHRITAMLLQKKK
jgi:hypothetical protein